MGLLSFTVVDNHSYEYYLTNSASAGRCGHLGLESVGRYVLIKRRSTAFIVMIDRPTYRETTD